jgi:hypothetical protein
LDKKKSAPAAKAAPAKPVKEKSNGHGAQESLPSTFNVGTRIKYNDGTAWVNGVVRSIEPAVLDLDDNTEIEISRDVLREAVALGIIAMQS